MDQVWGDLLDDAGNEAHAVQIPEVQDDVNWQAAVSLDIHGHLQELHYLNEALAQNDHGVIPGPPEQPDDLMAVQNENDPAILEDDPLVNPFEVNLHHAIAI